MGRMLMLILSVVIVIFGLMLLGMNRSNTNMVEHDVVAFSRLSAKNIAKSGIELAISHIFEDTTWSGVDSFDVGNGNLEVDVSTTTGRYPNSSGSLPSARQIVSTGMYAGINETIMSVVQLPPRMVPPPSFKYALGSDANISLSGNMRIQADWDKNWNANIHTNGALNVGGSDQENYGGKIRGYGTYANSTNLDDDDVDDYFNPYIDYPNQQKCQQVTTVEFPVYDQNSLKAEATTYYSGDQSFTSTMQLGTADNPEIIYVDGDLTLAGQFNGYGCFIVNGEVSITGTVDTDATSTGEFANRLGLYSSENIKIAGDATVAAQIYSERKIDFLGGCEIHGLAVAKKGLVGGGNTTIYYRPASDNIIPRTWWVERHGRPVMLSYYE